MDISDITGVILAGGTNSRFGGKIKANTIIGGEKIITSILKVIRPIFGEIVIVTNTPDAFSDIEGCIITGDHFLKRGPLGGIHAAMKASSKNAVFIFAADMPFLNSDLIISQAKEYCSDPVDVLIARLKGNIEPLHSVYNTKLVDKLEDFLSEGSDNMIRSFLDKLSVRFFNVPESELNTRSFTNINTPTEAEITNDIKAKENNRGERRDNTQRTLGKMASDSATSAITSANSAFKKELINEMKRRMVGISEILAKYSPDKEHLLSILHDIQNCNPEQFISEDDMKSVADYLNITISSVYGVVTYYSMFSLKPRGRYIIRICSSPVCDMTGSEGILKDLERKLRLGKGETTSDGLFTLETCECLGHCEEAPGMIINERFYGNLCSSEIDKIIDSLKTAGE
jgi:NADH-quinone oxidoreductase subunit E